MDDQRHPLCSDERLRTGHQSSSEAAIPIRQTPCVPARTVAHEIPHLAGSRLPSRQARRLRGGSFLWRLFRGRCFCALFFAAVRFAGDLATDFFARAAGGSSLVCDFERLKRPGPKYSPTRPTSFSRNSPISSRREGETEVNSLRTSERMISPMRSTLFRERARNSSKRSSNRSRPLPSPRRKSLIICSRSDRFIPENPERVSKNRRKLSFSDSKPPEPCSSSSVPGAILGA